jgi:flagellar biosynthetic protein FlhB
VGAVGVWVIIHRMDEIAHLATMPLGSAMGASVDILAFALLSMAALGIVALIDGPFQMFQYRKELRMSREEIRDRVQGSRRQPRDQVAHARPAGRQSRNRQMKDVPGSTVIVTNPTHYAVALRVPGRAGRRSRCRGQGRR